MTSGALAALVGACLMSDLIVAPELGRVSVGGFPGMRMDAALNERVFSHHARTTVYEEAVNAFRTHEDDRDPKRAGWQNEYWGKTMLVVAGAIAYTGDEELREWAIDRAHAFVREFQRENGYLSTYANEDRIGGPGFVSSFNIWGRKYTFWALIELYRVTGDVGCLNAAEKMADHLVGQLKRIGRPIYETGIWNGVSSASILKPLLLLQAIRPKPEYLALANDCFAGFDRTDGRIPNLVFNAFRKEPVASWYPRATQWAKAYEIMSCVEGWVELYRMTGNRRALDAAKAFHGHLVAEEVNPMRSVGYFDHFLMARQHANGMSELCDVTHWIRLNRELFLVTGEAKYLDWIEEAFYNAFLAGVQPDGAWGAHLLRSHGSRHLSAPAQTGMRYHQCCPDNMVRTFYDWAQTVACRGSDGTLFVNFYSDAEVCLPGARVSIAGNYPIAEEPVRISVRIDRPSRVRFRIPEWSSEFRLNGQKAHGDGGWLSVDAPQGTTTWTLAFDLSPRILNAAWEGVEAIPASVPDGVDPADDIGLYTKFFFEWMAPEMKGACRTNPSAQIMRGPLVLAKGRLVGSSKDETLSAKTINGGCCRVSLVPAKRTCANAAAWGAWTLTLSDADGERSVPVGDYASVSAVDDAENWFSLWF